MSSEWDEKLFQYFIRPPVKLFRTQLFEAGDLFDELFKPSVYCDEEAHVLTDTIAKDVVLCIKGNIDSHAKPNISWRNGILETGQPAVGSILLYSDKTKTTSKTNGATFYFHASNIYLLNVKNKSTEEKMNRGLKTVPFLPRKFVKVNDAWVPVLDDKLDRLGKLSYINFSMELIMEPTGEVAITDCSVQ